MRWEPLVEVLQDRYESFISDDPPRYTFRVTGRKAPDRDSAKTTLGEQDQSGLESFMDSMIDDKPTGRLSTRANRAALFIMLYRDFPLLQIPFQLLDTLIEIDDLMAAWRTRHISMVRRMIGGRAGTGGSAGAEYLRESRDKHLIFSELATLNSFLIQRNQVPVLPSELQSKLGFSA